MPPLDVHSSIAQRTIITPVRVADAPYNGRVATSPYLWRAGGGEGYTWEALEGKKSAAINLGERKTMGPSSLAVGDTKVLICFGDDFLRRCRFFGGHYRRTRNISAALLFMGRPFFVRFFLLPSLPFTFGDRYVSRNPIFRQEVLCRS